MMLKICAWCNKEMGFVGSDRDGGISHGICEACKNAQIYRFYEAIEEKEKNVRSIKILVA